MNNSLTHKTETLSVYEKFCQAINIAPIKQTSDLCQFSDIAHLANTSKSERLTSAVQVLLYCTSEEDETIHRVDKNLLDIYINKIDRALSAQLDEILHHSEFQAYESTWRGLQYLVDNTDFRANCKIELLNITKDALKDDFDDADEDIHSGLYKQVYEKEYDTPGGEPVTAMISPFTFDAGSEDIQLLYAIAKVAAATHCPFIGNVSPAFFGKDNIDAVASIDDLASYMERSEFIRWNAFRESDDARYIGLTLPRFLLRLPYGQDNKVRGFNYQEQVFESSDHYLWGAASFPFAANMAKSFKAYGWTVNIRGPESGGKVEQLPLHQYDFGRGLLTKIPTEMIIPETRELALSHLGFIPLSYYKNSNYACYFSANSTQKPVKYSDPQATANSRINARLPYIFLSARIAHYLKVLQRESIGSNVSRSELEDRLNTWLQTLITKMSNPDPEQSSLHPLRDGKVNVETIEDNPGFYRVSLYAMPHFQIEGVDVSLSIVGKMPTTEKK
jgi:type VI secretion system protein ImpC